MDPVRLFSDTFGVDYSAAAYLVGALSSIPVAYLHRFIGPPALRHVYAAVSGVLLSLISFTPDVLLHFILAAAFTLVVMRTQRSICGLVTFIGTFAHLIACHVIFMSDDARRTGRVDFTGTLTIVAIKLTSLAMDYQDGLKALKDDAKRAKDGEKPESEQPSRDDRRKAEKRARVIREMPSLVEFLGYLFCCGQHLLGPWFDYQSYDDWTHRRGVWSPSVRSPSPIPPFLRVLVQGSLAAAVFLLIFPHLDLSLATDPARFFVLPFLRRLLLVFHATLVTRWRCYIVWSIAEAAMVAGGLGFSGWVAKPSAAAGGGGAAAAATAAGGPVVAPSAAGGGAADTTAAAAAAAAAASAANSAAAGEGAADEHDGKENHAERNGVSTGQAAAAAAADGGQVMMGGRVMMGELVNKQGGSTAGVKGSAVSGEKKRSHAATPAAPAAPTPVTASAAATATASPAAAPTTAAAAATRTDADDAPECSRAERQVAASGAERQVASWDRARNVNILGMELASTGADVAKNWNISFSTWLRIYVYERLEAMPRKSALFNLLFTFFISAISHGLNPGDLIGFAHWALMIAGVASHLPLVAASSPGLAASPRCLAAALPLPTSLLTTPAPPHPPSPPWFLFPPLAFLCTSFIIYNLLSLSWCSFVQVMTFQHTVQAYRGLYYYGTLVPVMLIVAGNFIRTPRPRGAKKSLKTE
ncbi:unnamed protein product [Closterium sp. NIES-64]|nr:unnamed protein product [Closterium sp. NIES-64]